MASPQDVLLDVIAILDRLGIPYYLGGSYASGIHGTPRFTRDADLVVDIKLGQVRELAEALSNAYYVDTASIFAALKAGRSFNIVHLATHFKVDLFSVEPDSLSAAEMCRRVKRELGDRPIAVCSAEGTILAKLRWYRDGEETSDQQWNDVLGILEVQSGKLDLEYLASWATRLGVADLLKIALDEAR